MSGKLTVGFVLYGGPGAARDLFTEEKYRLLAAAFAADGFDARTVLWPGRAPERWDDDAAALDALLVWVNPIEQGADRAELNRRLTAVAGRGVVASALPSVLDRIGTKRVLYDTRDLPFGSEVFLYPSQAAFRERFPEALGQSGVRVLKQERGDGGNGVFKVSLDADSPGSVRVLHALRGSSEQVMTEAALVESLRGYFSGGRPLFDQPWCDDLERGMVRCYLTGGQVAGFGYQEVNALARKAGPVVTPGKRYYFSEECELFQDLRARMEGGWVAALAERCGVSAHDLPVLWDCDFFLGAAGPLGARRWTLCEINVSCVSPFPESAVPRIVAETRRRILLTRGAPARSL